jgi:two-component system chemotaxis response regulator CheB
MPHAISRAGGLRARRTGAKLRRYNAHVVDQMMAAPAETAVDDEPVGFQVIALAASAGGLDALSTVLARLPEDLPAALLVVQHLDRAHRSLLADILDRRSALHVEEAKTGAALHFGVAYIAPPDQHLLVNPDGHIVLTHSELVHFLRPSADLMFESVAGSYQRRAIAVVLTGTGSDGSLGVQAIKKTGGTVIAQDQATSDFFGMPGAAIDTGCVDYVVPLPEIAPLLIRLIEGGCP